MSYTIIYDAFAVETPNNEIVLFMQMGDNNSYTVSYTGKEKRARDWSIPMNIYLDKQSSSVLIDKNTAIKNVENIINNWSNGDLSKSSDIAKNSKFITYKQLLTYVVNKIKNPIDVADFLNESQTIAYNTPNGALSYTKLDSMATFYTLCNNYKTQQFHLGFSDYLTTRLKPKQAANGQSNTSAKYYLYKPMSDGILCRDGRNQTLCCFNSSDNIDVSHLKDTDLIAGTNLKGFNRKVITFNTVKDAVSFLINHNVDTSGKLDSYAIMQIRYYKIGCINNDNINEDIFELQTKLNVTPDVYFLRLKGKYVSKLTGTHCYSGGSPLRMMTQADALRRFELLKKFNGSKELVHLIGTHLVVEMTND